MSTKPKITSLLVGESDTVEIEAPKTLLLEVIEPTYIDLDML